MKSANVLTLYMNNPVPIWMTLGHFVVTRVAPSSDGQCGADIRFSKFKMLYVVTGLPRNRNI